VTKWDTNTRRWADRQTDTCQVLDQLMKKIYPTDDDRQAGKMTRDDRNHIVTQYNTHDDDLLQHCNH